MATAPATNLSPVFLGRTPVAGIDWWVYPDNHTPETFRAAVAESREAFEAEVDCQMALPARRRGSK